MSAKETSEVILLVIKRLLKWIFLVCLGFGIFAILIWAALSLYQWFDYDRHVNKVVVRASIDSKVCPKDYPLYVGITNNSSKTIKSISVNVEVTKIGFSSRLNNYDRYEYDKILKPNESWGECWQIEELGSYSFARKYLDGAGKSAKVITYFPIFL